MTRAAVPARLSAALEDPLVAVLGEIGNRCAAAQSAVRGGRRAWARRWVEEILDACPRLAVAADRALGTEEEPAL